MHMVIRAIVYAKSRKKALGLATGIFEQLTGDDRPFDYFTMFDNPGSSVSGKGRWGEMPACSKASSREGGKMISEGWDATVKEFNDAMKEIREALACYTDEEIMEEKSDKPAKDGLILSLIRHKMYQVGQYSGSSYWLYDQDGSAIRDKGHLDNVMNKWACLDESRTSENPYKDLDIWVVPADVHF